MALPLEADARSDGVEAPTGIGVILHDANTSFTAAIGGGQVRRGNSYAELETDRLWLTDLDYQTYSAHGRPYGNLRSSGYLSADLRNVIQEWGLHDTPHGPAADALHTIMARVHRLATETETHLARRLTVADHSAVGAMTLATGFSRHFEAAGLVRGGRLQDAPTRLPAALSNCWQTSSHNAASTNIPKGSFLVRLRQPRFDHAYDALRVPAPSGAWRYLPEGALDDPLAALEAEGKPALVRLSWTARTGLEPLAGLIGWERTGERGEIRRWAPLEEVRMLSRIGEVQIRDALVCDGWAQTNLAHLLLGPFLDDNETHSRSLRSGLSWSAGVVAESILAGFLRTPQKGYAPTATAAWTAWRVREPMLNAAFVLTDAGFQVHSTRLSTVSVVANDETLPSLLAAALRAGLLPPLSALDRAGPEAPAFDINAWGGPKTSAPYASLFYAGNRTAIAYADRCAELTGDDLKAAFDRLKPILGAALQGRSHSN